MGRPSIAEQRRVEIAKALRDCMRFAPYDDISTKEIATEAKMPQGLIFHYFSTKHDILMRMLQLQNDDNAKGLQKWVDTAPKALNVDELIDIYVNRIHFIDPLDLKLYTGITNSIFSLCSYDDEVRQSLAESYNVCRGIHSQLLGQYIKDPVLLYNMITLIMNFYDSFWASSLAQGYDIEVFKGLAKQFFQIFKTCPLEF